MSVKTCQYQYIYVPALVWMVCQVMLRTIHIYLIFSSFSSDVTSVIQWDAEREAASFHLKSIRLHAGSEVQASTLPEPLQHGTEPEKLCLQTHICHIRAFHTAFS